LLAHVVLREVLGGYLQIAPAEVMFGVPPGFEFPIDLGEARRQR
jgi:hypothetical protein